MQFGENARFCSVCRRYEALAGFELKKSKLDHDQKTGKEYHTFIKGGRNNACTLSVRNDWRLHNWYIFHDSSCVSLFNRASPLEGNLERRQCMNIKIVPHHNLLRVLKSKGDVITSA